MENITVTILNDIEIDVVVHSPPWYEPAKTNALPEDCYPEDGGDAEWELGDDNGEFIEMAVDCSNKLVDIIDKEVQAYYEA